MDTSQYRLKYVLVGASGVGKTTMSGILEKALGFRRCITSTNRPVRPGEVDGIDYYFRKTFVPEEMFEMSTFGDFQYGITHRELTRGNFIILEPQGVQYYREHYPKPLIVIQLRRNNIQVDAQRKDRDKTADFDNVNPDITITGETIDTMAANLLSAIARFEKTELPHLDAQICAAQKRGSGAGEQNDMLHGPSQRKEKRQTEPVR